MRATTAEQRIALTTETADTVQIGTRCVRVTTVTRETSAIVSQA